MYDVIHSAAEKSGVAMNVTHVVDDPGATAILVSVKSLIGFASASRAMYVGSFVGGVRPIPVQLYDPVPNVDLYAVWRPDITALGEAFLDRMEAAGPFQSPSLGLVDSHSGR
ncbi:hypothetical protein I4J48_23550 [Pseudonocardia sp. KRD-169]|nr:hypothetical protein [Pseudonocardia abyssalis]